MLRVHTLPGSPLRVLGPFRSCFTTPTFATFVTLLAGVWHHSRAHRLFATAKAGAQHWRYLNGQ